MNSIVRRLGILSAALLLLALSAVTAISAETETSEQSQRITATELKQLVDKGSSFLIVDVRSYEEFNKMHITGAIPVPLHQVEAKLGQLSPDTKMAFY